MEVENKVDQEKKLQRRDRGAKWSWENLSVTALEGMISTDFDEVGVLLDKITTLESLVKSGYPTKESR
jgi:hypothetical protein